MMNEGMMKMLIDGYNKVAYTHEYMFGFADRGMVYVAICKSDMMPYICTLNKASSKCGGGYSLRFKPNKSQKELLKTCECYMLCSVEHFNNVFENSKYNRGEIFEKLVTEHYGQTWEKDNVPFTEGGDLEVNGVAYQLKYEKATFCSESSLANLIAKA